MDIREWARQQLPIPTVNDIMGDANFRDTINGISDALGITRYRAAKLIQIDMEKQG